MIAAYLYFRKRHQKKKAAQQATAARPTEPNLLSNAQYNEDAVTHVHDESKVNKEQPSSPISNVPTEAEKREKSKARWYMVRLIVGLFFPYFIASTDVTSNFPPWLPLSSLCSCYISLITNAHVKLSRPLCLSSPITLVCVDHTIDD